MVAIIRDTHIVFNRIKYFRTQAENVVLGSYGEKKSRYLAVKGEMPMRDVPIKEATVVEVKFTKQAERQFGGEAGAPVKAVDLHGKATATFGALRTGQLKLVKLRVLPFDVAEQINKDRRVVRHLRNDRAKARIANEIFVVMEAKLAKKITRGGDISVSAGKGKIKISAKASGKRNEVSTVVISKGTTFAYLLQKPEWDHRLVQRRRAVVNFEDDQYGAK